MPRTLYQQLLRYLLFVNNDSINAQDKVAKIRPLISMVRGEFVKIEPEQYSSVDQQSIHLSDNTTRKSQKSEDLKILFALASMILCMTFSFKMGKALQS